MDLKKFLKGDKFEKLKKDIGVENDLAMPDIEKIVVSVGLNELREEEEKIESAKKQLAATTGQKPVEREAKQSVSAFGVSEGDTVGLQVTLRNEYMYNFLKKLTDIILPGWKAFKGVPRESLTPQGNLSIGLPDTVAFPEIDYEKVENPVGMSVTIVTTADKREPAEKLLKSVGIVFEAVEVKKMREEAERKRKEEKKLQKEKEKFYKKMAKSTEEEEPKVKTEEGEEE